MEDNRIEKKYYIGASKNGRWSSVYTYKPRNEHFFGEKGEIFATISLEGPRAFNSSTAGNLLLDYLHESYFEGEESSPLLCLEKAVIGTAKKLSEIVDNDQNIGDHGINLDITAMAIVDNIAYFVVMGRGAIFLYRGEDLVKINEALRDPTGDGYVKTASGVVENGDVFQVLSAQAVEAFTQNELKSSAAKFSEVELKEKPLEDESMLSLLIIGVGVEPEVSVEEVEVVEKKEEKAKSFVKNEEIEDGLNNVKHITDESAGDLSEKKDDVVVPVLKKRSSISKYLKKLNNFKNSSLEKVKEVEMGAKLKKRWDGLSPEDSEDTTFVYLIKKIRLITTNLLRSLKKIIWDDFLQMNDGLYLKDARRGTNWRLIGVVAVIAILLIYIGSNRISANQEKARKEREVTETIGKVSESIDKLGPEINSILGVVDIYNREKSKYQTELNQARNDLNSIKSYEIESTKIENLLSQVVVLENKLNRTIVVSDPSVVVDFATAVAENAKPSDMEIVDNKIYITDSSRGVVYSVNYDGSELNELASGLNGPKSIGVAPNGNIYAVDSSSSEPFLSVNKSSGKVDRYSGLFSEGLGTVKQIEAIDFNGTIRIYFIKTTGSPVQYIGQVGEAFAGAYDRLSDASFSTAQDFEISDGKLYFLMPSEGAVRYYGDSKEEFSTFGLSRDDLGNLLNSTAFEVSGNYIIYGNSSGKSVVFTTKTRGEELDKSDYVAQYKVDTNTNIFSDIKEIKADYVSGNIFVLDGTRVIKLDINDISQFVY